MSDLGRESFTDKASAALKVSLFCVWEYTTLNPLYQPDSQKSTTEHMGDKLKGNTDSAFSTVQPQVHSRASAHTYPPRSDILPVIDQSEKSTSQKLGDTFSSNQNHDDRSMMDKAKDAVGLGSNKEI